MEVIRLSGSESTKGGASRQPPPLDELRKEFPPEKGFTVEHAEWVELVDGECRRIPIAVVRGPGGVEITFFPEKPRGLPKSRRQD